MKNIKNSVFLLFILLFAAQSVFASGGNRNGTAGAQQLQVPVGTRGIAMGGSTIVNSEGAEAIYWNPANLARSTGSEAFLSQMNYIADIGVTYGVVSTNIEGLGAIGISLKSIAIGDILKTTVADPDGTGATFKPQFTTVGLTYAKMLSDRIAVGMTLNYVYERLDQVSAQNIAINLGISYTNLANINGLSFGIVMKNLGPQMKYDGTGLLVEAEVSDFKRSSELYKIESSSFELPSTLELGLGYKFNYEKIHDFVVNAVFQNNNFDNDKYNVGFEYGFNKFFFLRAGYQYQPDNSSDQNTFGPNFGAGIKYNLGGLDLRVDYAYRAVKYDALNNNHVFSLGIGF